MTDPIADLLTRIRNISMTSHKDSVIVPYSTQKEEILKVLTKEQYILGFNKDKDENGFDILIVELDPEKKDLFEFKRVSKPGQRIYKKAKNLEPVMDGLGISIVSTSQGLMSNKEAYRQKLGGEILLEVW